MRSGSTEYWGFTVIDITGDAFEFRVGNETTALTQWGSSFLGVGTATTRAGARIVIPIAEFAGRGL